MIGLQNGQPGPGQGLARRGIQVARAGITDKGAQARIDWVPGVSGNELADSWAVDETRWGKRRREGDGNMSRGRVEKVSLAFLKARRKKKAIRE